MIEYDSSGRMKYNPEFHRKHGQLWDKDDLEYLIGWYDKIGVEEMSFALERPISAVSQKVKVLRERGIMPKHEKKIRHTRVRYENERNMIKG